MKTMLISIAAGFWSTLCEMSPYLLFGFFVAGILSLFVSPALVERHLGGSGFRQVFKASAFGVPLPLCSCGVIPVAASLRKHGAGKGAVASFLLSTPQTGVDSIFATWSLMGPVFAILRPVAAFFSGLLGGWLVDRYDGDNQPDNGAERLREVCTEACCAPEQHRRPRWLEALRYGFVVLPADLARPMLAGLALAGVIGALVPDQFFSETIGTGWPAMLVMLAVGIPLYVCATASVPIAASMMMKGLSPGAALVFLMTGPATNGATLAIIWKVLGKRTAAIYLGTVAFMALAFGYLLDRLWMGGAVAALAHHHHPEAAGTWMTAASTASAVVLLGILGYGMWRGAPKTQVGLTTGGAAGNGDGLELVVTGMTCSRCGESVAQALKSCAGVTGVEVDVPRGRAVVYGTGLDIEQLRRAIESAGYHAGTAS